MMNYSVGIALLFAIIFPCSAATVVWPAANLDVADDDVFLASDESAAGLAGSWGTIAASESAAVVQFEFMTIGVGHIWYECDLGDPITAETVATADPFVNSFIGQGGALTLDAGETIYAAFYVDGGGVASDVYGWVALVYDGTTLTLVDSAAETSGVGIYAGTYTPIPEPDTACLALTGLAVLAVGRRWRQRQAARAFAPCWCIGFATPSLRRSNARRPTPLRLCARGSRAPTTRMASSRASLLATPTPLTTRSTTAAGWRMFPRLPSTPGAQCSP